MRQGYDASQNVSACAALEPSEQNLSPGYPAKEKSVQKICEQYLKPGTGEFQHVISVLTHSRKSEKSYTDQTEGGSNQTPIPCNRKLVPIADRCKSYLKNRNDFLNKKQHFYYRVYEYILKIQPSKARMLMQSYRSNPRLGSCCVLETSL